MGKVIYYLDLDGDNIILDCVLFRFSVFAWLYIHGEFSGYAIGVGVVFIKLNTEKLTLNIVLTYSASKYLV